MILNRGQSSYEDSLAPVTPLNGGQNVLGVRAHEEPEKEFANW
jgi:hypothetical protein